jgi:hypothetical protein
MTAARIWKIYRESLAEDRRLQWATGFAVIALAATAWFATWALFVLAFYVGLGLAILRSGLFDSLLPADPDYDEF